MRDLIAQLRGHERAQNRSTPLEITLSPRLEVPLTVELVNEFARAGVSRLIIPGARDTERALATMEQFHSQVMARQ